MLGIIVDSKIHTQLSLLVAPATGPDIHEIIARRKSTGAMIIPANKQRKTTREFAFPRARRQQGP
jgi:hypothetical protein